MLISVRDCKWIGGRLSLLKKITWHKDSFSLAEGERVPADLFSFFWPLRLSCGCNEALEVTSVGPCSAVCAGAD